MEWRHVLNFLSFFKYPSCIQLLNCILRHVKSSFKPAADGRNSTLWKRMFKGLSEKWLLNVMLMLLQIDVFVMLTWCSSTTVPTHHNCPCSGSLYLTAAPKCSHKGNLMMSCRFFCCSAIFSQRVYWGHVIMIHTPEVTSVVGPLLNAVMGIGCIDALYAKRLFSSTFRNHSKRWGSRISCIIVHAFSLAYLAFVVIFHVLSN